MIIRQFFDPVSRAFSYIVGDDATLKAAIIDPVAEHAADYYDLLEDLGLQLVYILETHLHSDHQTGAGILREVTGAQTAIPEKAEGYYADLFLKGGDTLVLGDSVISVHETPGHTMACVTYSVGCGHLFTGDLLWIGDAGETETHLGGCAVKHFQSITQKLFSFPDHYRVYPGHGAEGDLYTTIGREKQDNHVIAGRDLSSFMAIMKDRDNNTGGIESDTLSDLVLV